MPYRTIDLCAGIGGIRRGFELTGNFTNVLSAEKDKYACITYEHLFGENPENDVTCEEFKALVDNTEYDVLLAGFPCQTFSRAGLQEGFEDQDKGIIFEHIAEIIERTRPLAIFLENVDHLVRHNNGQTFRYIIETLENDLNYKIIGVNRDHNGNLVYNSRDFIRNSRNFGVPQNRPRTYIIGFSRGSFNKEPDILNMTLPEIRAEALYGNLNDLLENDVELKYYMASGYWETLKRHKERQKRNNNGFGYRVVNLPNNANPIANTLLATGGSGKERNLIYQPIEIEDDVILPGKKTPLNVEGIRVMTPTEWGKLQGFINYAFLDENGNDNFDFPDNLSNAQKYKQFGNSVTIPTIETMANHIYECLEFLNPIL